MESAAAPPRRLPAALEGLRDIFTAFTEAPDYSACYEPDLNRRMMRAWQRIGDSMRLAMGQPVAREMEMLGEKIRFEVRPTCGDPKRAAAIRKARANSPDADTVLASKSYPVQTRLTGKEAQDFIEILRKDGLYDG